MPSYDVFLSHASADKPAVEHLAHKLREKGLEPFLDKWHLIPGEPWQEALEEALDQSRTCAVFLGKTLGPWQNEEMRSALESRVRDGRFRVIPVLLPGGKERGKEKLPRFLSRLTWVDFRTGLDDESAFYRLLAGIRGTAPGPGGRAVEKPPLPYRTMAPAREPFVQRSEYAKVRDALLADGPARSTTIGITTAIHGAGGFGKTALAIELCYDEQVREKYPDGILWTTMGEEIDAAGRLARVRDLIRWWTDEDPPAFETVSAASAHLRQDLDGKRVLLVVDDVWRPEDVTPFQGLGPRAALLVTTRDSRTLPADSKSIHVDAMEVPEAVRLLSAGLPAGAEAELKTLAALLGEWPLLLKIVNRQVSSWISKGLDLREAIHRAENTLKARGLTYFDPKDAKERSQASALTLEVSLERLSSEEQKRFAELAIFPEDTNVPLTVLEKLWQLDTLDVEELASRFFDLSLLRNFDLRSGTIRLHDVIRAYLLKKGESHLPEWHRRLLDACRPASGRWPDLPRDESYLWNHLFHHLIGAGQSNVCRALLLDFHYLRSKLGATDVNALLADYSAFAENDEELRLVRDALRLSAHVLTKSQAELRGQLWWLLQDRQEKGVRDLLDGSKSSSTPWIRPRRVSFNQPGEALISTIDHGGSPSALTVLPGNRVVSGSYTKLQVWDVGSGQILQLLEGHSNWICSVAGLDRCRVVSGSADRTLRLWDVESGQTLQILKGHSGSVNVVAILNSRQVVSSSDDRTTRIWDLDSGNLFQVLEEHSSYVGAMAVLESRWLLNGYHDGTLRVWDVESGKILQVLTGNSSAVRAVAWLDSHRVISGSYDGTLRTWDVESGRILQIFEGHSLWVNAVAVLDSRRVISGSADGTLRVWDGESGRTLQIFEGHYNAVVGLAMLDGCRVVSSSYDQTLRVWDVARSQALQPLERHSDWVVAVAVLESHRVVSSAYDGNLRVWDVESGQTLQTLEGTHSDWVVDLATLDGRRVVSCSYDRTLRVWDIDSSQTIRILEGHASKVHALAALNSRQVVSGSSDGAMRVWDVESGETLRILQVHASQINALAMLDDHRIVSSSEDRTLKVSDVENGKILQSLQVVRDLEGNVNSIVAMTALNRQVVVFGTEDGKLRLWDAETGRIVRTFQGHSSGVRAIAVLDGRWVISGASYDRTVRVWDTKSDNPECLFTLDAPVTAIAVVAGRRIVVVGDDSGRVHFLDFVEP